MKESSDTIAAISTAPGEAGIAIVRISGPASLEIADRVFRGNGAKPSQRKTGSFIHGFVRSSSVTEEADADEVVLLVYRAPRSYTREDVVEIQGHGGRSCAKRILRLVLDSGARSAEPGEFTRRAFLNGRIDLLQAEAVADLIMAKSDRAAGAAIEQLEGRLSDSISDIYDNLMNAAAALEASLDFPEEELPASLLRTSRAQIESSQKKLEQLMATWGEGHLLRDGALVVISGKPNAGKSTLLNALLGKNRAIVADEPGTTRDTIEEELIIEGTLLRLVDTAGLRDTKSAVEREGVKRAEDLITKADLNLYVIDSSVAIEQTDRQRLSSLDKGKCLLVLNKTDLGRAVQNGDLMGFSCISCSLLRNTDINELKTAISNKLGMRLSAQQHAVISERHRQAIRGVIAELNSVLDILRQEKEENLIVPAITSLRQGIELLGTINGMNYDNMLLDKIFGQFCIGK